MTGTDLDSDEIIEIGAIKFTPDRVADLDPQVLSEIVVLTAATTWPLRHVFRAAAERAFWRGLPRAGEERPFDGPPTQTYQPSPPLVGNQLRKPVQGAEVSAVLDAAAADREGFPGFEQRAEQGEMAAAVAAALSENQKLVVEAGTGTGKSLAYLLPASIFA